MSPDKTRCFSFSFDKVCGVLKKIHVPQKWALIDKVTNLFIKFLDFFLHYMNAWNLLPYGNKFGHTRTSVSSILENKEFSLQWCRITASHSLIVPIISWLSKYLTCPKSTLLWFSPLKYVLVAQKIKKWDCFIPALPGGGGACL